MTPLTPGVDRDSSPLADPFDAHDPAVKRLIEAVVRGAHRKKPLRRRDQFAGVGRT